MLLTESAINDFGLSHLFVVNVVSVRGCLHPVNCECKHVAKVLEVRAKAIFRVEYCNSVKMAMISIQNHYQSDYTHKTYSL